VGVATDNTDEQGEALEQQLKLNILNPCKKW